MLFLPKPVWSALKRYQIIQSLSELNRCCAFCSLWWVAGGRVAAPPWVRNVFGVPVYRVTVNDNGKLWSMWQKAKICPMMWRCLSAQIHEWHLQLIMEMTLLIWTRNLKKGLMLAFSSAQAFWHDSGASFFSLQRKNRLTSRNVLHLFASHYSCI